MGHGKSSFCKMIVNDSEKYRVKAHVSIKSETLDCNFYISNRFNDIFGQDIVVIDTPGLDSKATISLIAEDIDDFIIKYKLQIAGIAYVLNVKERQQNQQETTHIFTFMDVLRIKYCYKINLAFCILSKYDTQYEEQETFDQLTKQFSELFAKNKYDKMWERNIKWMSQPVKDQKLYHRKKDTLLKREFEEQFSKLNHFLKTIQEKKEFLSYKAYESDRRQFESLFKDSLIKSYDQFQYQEEIKSFHLTIEIKQVVKGLFKHLSGTAAITLGVQWAATSFTIGTSLITEAYLAGSFALLAPAALPILLGCAGLKLAFHGANALKSEFNGQLKNITEQQRQQILTQRIRQKLQGFLLCAVIAQGNLDDNIFSFNSLPYITKIQSFDEQGKTIPVTQIKESDQLIYKSVLKVGKNRIKFFYKTPSDQYYEEFLKEMSRRLYNSRPQICPP